MTDSKVKLRPASQPPWLAIACLLCASLARHAPAATENPPFLAPEAPPSSHGAFPPTGTSLPWLDEVRLQREAWEARRANARELHEQRRRLAHPRGAAQREAWEENLRQRRAQRQERIDQDRERFRSLAPEPPPLPPSSEAGMAREPTDPAALPTLETPLFTPPVCNNLWYFRGF